MATTSGQAPLSRSITANTAAVAAASDATPVVGEAPIDGIVTGVSYTPVANVTGANTETRTLSLVNKGSDGNGSTVVATLALTSGVNLSDYDEKALTLSGTPANLTVVAGDILAFSSVHSGSTGLADPGGSVKVDISRD